MNIKLGQRARDKVTGFEGVVDHIVYPLYDSIKIGIQAPVKDDGDLGSGYIFDHVGVETISDEIVVKAIPSKPKYQLGAKAKCTITGFEGIIVAYVTHLNGCVHYRVQPKMPQGKKAEDYGAQKFPEGALEVERLEKEHVPQETGGPYEASNKSAFY